MPLKVIGAGWGRTGTLSLKLALEQLGFAPCHHMTEIVTDPDLMDFWNRLSDNVVAGTPIDWDECFAHWPATVDWPACGFYAELAEAYPEAKVVLTERDPESWYASMAGTILQSMPLTGTDAPPAHDHPMRFGARLVTEKAFNYDLSRENVIAAYNRHNAEVRARIPADRLLVFEVSQGWDPLCEFLGVPVPNKPFPRSNARDEFWTYAEQAGAKR